MKRRNSVVKRIGVIVLAGVLAFGEVAGMTPVRVFAKEEEEGEEEDGEEKDPSTAQSDDCSARDDIEGGGCDPREDIEGAAEEDEGEDPSTPLRSARDDMEEDDCVDWEDMDVEEAEEAEEEGEDPSTAQPDDCDPRDDKEESDDSDPRDDIEKGEEKDPSTTLRSARDDREYGGVCFALAEDEEATMEIPVCDIAADGGEEAPDFSLVPRRKASEFKNGETLWFEEDSVLVMDTDLYLTGLYGECSLRVEGSGKLTVNNNVSDVNGIGFRYMQLGEGADVTLNSKSTEQFAMFTSYDLLIEKGAKLSIYSGGGLWSNGDIDVYGEFVSNCTQTGAIISSSNIRIWEDASVVASGGYDFTADWRFGIGAGLDLIVKGELVADGTDAVYSQSGDIYIIKPCKDIRGENYGIYARGDSGNTGGHLYLKADTCAKATSSSKGYGIWSKRGVFLSSEYITAEGPKAAIYCDNSIIELSPGLSFISPVGAYVKDKVVKDSSGKTAQYVYSGRLALTGDVTIEDPVPGKTCIPKISGGTLDSIISDPDKRNGLFADWEYYKDGKWIVSASGESVWDGHVVSGEEAGCPIRVSVYISGWTGKVTSPAVTAAKRINGNTPAAPILNYDGGKLVITNAKADQEYIIYTSKQAAIQKTAWEKSFRPEADGAFEPAYTPDCMNYVYTRIRETESSYAGWVTAWNGCYCGESEALQDIELEISDADGKSHLSYAGAADTYSCAAGSVIKIDVRALPAAADNAFEGIKGDSWLINGSSSSTDYGDFFVNKECSIPIGDANYYRTVYLSIKKDIELSGGSLNISAERYMGANTKHCSVYLYVGDSEGRISPESLFVTASDIYVAPAQKLSGIGLQKSPVAANDISAVSVRPEQEGSSPAVTLNADFTMDIDAGEVLPGSYAYGFYLDGKRIGSFTIMVSGVALEGLALSQSSIEGRRGMSYELIAQLTPSNAQATVGWSSSTPSVAAVKDGIVTIDKNAAYGSKAVITASAGGLESSCTVSVYGQEYPLTVCGVKVDTDNMEDILGDGVFSFNGKSIITAAGAVKSDKTIIESSIDGLTLNVLSPSSFEGKGCSLIKAQKDLVITGCASLSLVTDTGYCIEGEGGSLTIDGMDMSLKSDTGVVRGFGGGIVLQACEIASPGGVSIENGSLMLGSTPAKEAVIKCGVGMRVIFNDSCVKNSGGKYTAVYTGQSVKPAVMATHNGVMLTEGVDYTVKYSNNKNVDKKGAPAKVTVSGKGSYTKKLILEFYIEPADISAAVTGNTVYQEGKKPEPVLTYNGAVLKNKKDYTFEEKDGKLLISGCGNFTGSITKEVKSLDKTAMQGSGINVSVGKVSRSYNGKPQELDVSELIVTDKSGNPLTKDKDYAVTYSDNVNAGSVKLTVTGIGDHSGKVTKSFKITPAKDAVISAELKAGERYYYKKGGVRPKPVVKATIGAYTYTLTEGRDYKLGYSGNKKVNYSNGSVTAGAKFSISFLGNYKGAAYSGDSSFMIEPAPVSAENIRVICGDMRFTKFGKYQPKVMVIADGCLVPASDYTIDYAESSEVVNGATKLPLYVNSKAGKNYSFKSVYQQYNVTEDKSLKDISKAKLQFVKDGEAVNKLEYTGNEIRFDAGGDVKLKLTVDKSTTLDQSSIEAAFEVIYADNVEKGKATVILLPKAGSGYTGICSAGFKITAKPLENK
ncbi:MAG: hypothetical protein IKI75_02830 [Lachnospiraceae bacterium]|nr:hypothetical protein [Lachnospiraceae bacterium]